MAMKIEFTLHSSNGSVFDGGDPLILEAPALPRQGDVVDLNDALSLRDEPTTFMVNEVIWINRGGCLVPTVTCRQCSGGTDNDFTLSRKNELLSYGWFAR